MTREVRYHRLRPAQATERRKACPIAYIPIGTLEWHGVHNPLGADTLQAEYLAELCARKGGGLAMPPLYYGEVRTEALVDISTDWNKDVTEYMGLDPGCFSPERFIYTAQQQYENYQRLLLHILNEVETLGFKVAVILAGHYPLIDQARAAALLHNRQERLSERMLAWATCDYLTVLDKYDCAGDHGGGWETSHCMAIDSGMVDLSLLPPKGERVVGAGGRMAPQDATAEFGVKIFDDAADIVIKEARHRLEHPHMYRGNGRTMRERLWEKE